MVVKALDKQGNEVLMFDPSAVYLNQEDLDDSQARFRIFGQARQRQRGLRIVQDKIGGCFGLPHPQGWGNRITSGNR